MLQYIFIFAAISGAVACRQNYVPRNGDLIFRQSARSEVESSIQGVTNSIDGYDFTHVGIVYIDESGAIFVLEATPPEVTLTAIEEYLRPAVNEDEDAKEDKGGDKEEDADGGKAGNADPVSVAARLKPKFRHLIPQALAEGMLLKGKQYDYAYRMNDDSYYCSELIYEIFRKANDGQELFPLNDMTFKSPETGEITDGWIKYFDKFGVPIPEGEKGTNPGAMSRSDVIDILGEFENLNVSHNYPLLDVYNN